VHNLAGPLLTERRVPGQRFSRTRSRRAAMHPAQTAQPVAIPFGNTRERWLSLSLLASSLALLAWCIVAL
jgi:hypothetical protein